MSPDQLVKPPDVNMFACSATPATDRRQKGNPSSEPPLKCPRCDSSNTKFCYYNNYSLTQPRHYCKSCRRHWTNGGSLRNVPIGGGCRKMKRVKQRSADPNALLSLDETAVNMLASIGTNCSSKLPHFSGPLSSNFSDKSREDQMLNLAFSHLRESLGLREHSATGSPSPALLCMGSPNTPGLPSLMSGMADYSNAFVTRGYGTPTVKLEHGAMINNGSDLCSAFDCPGTHMAASATATLASLEEQLSSFSSLPVESFDNSNLESQWKTQPQKLALHLASGIQGGVDRPHALPAFEDETHENMTRHFKRKSTSVDGRTLPSTDWHQNDMNLFDPGADYHNFWNQSTWPDMHALAGSTARALL